MELLKCFKQLERFFKLDNFNSYKSIKLLQSIMFDPALFFYVYKRIGKAEVHCLCYNSQVMELLQFKDQYSKEIDKTIIQFLLRKNLKLISQRQKELKN